MDESQLDELIEVQNRIFADYIVPMRSSKEFFLDFQRSVGGGLSNLIVAMDGDKVIGYVNPIMDGSEAWVGGVGVVPERRGEGHGRSLMLAAEELARARGVKEMTLEVIQGNDKAIAMYWGLGYRDSKIYVCAEGKPVQFAGYGPQPRKATAAELLPMHAEAYADTCWQRRKACSLHESARTAEGYAVDGGFVLVRKVGTTGYIPYLGVAPGRRGSGIGTSLAKFALNRLWELGTFKVAIYNLNEEPAVIRLLDKFDFAITMKQIEMRKSLTAP